MFVVMCVFETLIRDGQRVCMVMLSIASPPPPPPIRWWKGRIDGWGAEGEAGLVVCGSFSS